MDFGIPREIRSREQRAALTPAGVKTLSHQGHRVFVERGAGEGAGHDDADYQAAGATIAYSREELFARAAVVGTVFAPEPREYALLRHGQVVFGFWGLPAVRREDVLALRDREVTAVGLEAIADEEGSAPVLQSMSEIAGGLAISVGSVLLLNEYGGRGILLGGAPAVPPGTVVILGAGALGRAAARAARGAGAEVILLDRSVEHLRVALGEVGRPCTTMIATRPNLETALSAADLVLGAVAVRGERAPVLVTREMLALLRPRSVVMDLSIDMGGCFETSRPTAFPTPTYEVDGIVHFCVPNLPSVAARSSTAALTNAVLPYLEEVGARGFDRAVDYLADLRRGTYLHEGRCVHEALARAFTLPWEYRPGAIAGPH